MTPDEQLQRDLERLRTVEMQHDVPAGQLQRIMQRAIQRRAEHEARPLRWVSDVWSLRLRFSFGALVLAGTCVVGATAGIVMLTKPERDVAASRSGIPTSAVSSDTTLAAAPIEQSVAVRFMLPAVGAKSVTLVGDFNAWQTDVTPLDDSDGDGIFAATLMLPRGSYGYMFVIDGENWTTDPHATNYRDDGFGQRNAVIRVN